MSSTQEVPRARVGVGHRLAAVWRSDGSRRFRNNRAGMVAAGFLLLLVLAAIFAPLISIDPNLTDPVNKLQPPTQAHIFGTDSLGRDLFARVLAGARVSLTVAIASTILSLLISSVPGILAGYKGGVWDEGLSRVFDMLFAIPMLLLAIVIVAALGGSLGTMVFAVSVAFVPRYARLFRAGTLNAKNQEYVQAAISLGIHPFLVVLRHVVPNIIVPIAVIAVGNMGKLALTESALSFLGAGIQPPDASWGNIMASGQPALRSAPWVAIIPGTVLALMVIAFTFVGDTLRDAFDIRESAGSE